MEFVHNSQETNTQQRSEMLAVKIADSAACTVSESKAKELGWETFRGHF